MTGCRDPEHIYIQLAGSTISLQSCDELRISASTARKKNVQRELFALTVFGTSPSCFFILVWTGRSPAGKSLKALDWISSNLKAGFVSIPLATLLDSEQARAWLANNKPKQILWIQVAGVGQPDSTHTGGLELSQYFLAKTELKRMCENFVNR
ncbi:hypothetical protein PM082_012771 [Marasmius tenuissimus]|nr:hypothetical protein PM082_012771 [Marasmius tenuissimus]